MKYKELIMENVTCAYEFMNNWVLWVPIAILLWLTVLIAIALVLQIFGVIDR